MEDDWFNLKLIQTKTSGDYKFSIFVDKIEVYSAINAKPEVFKNVQAEFGRMRDHPDAWKIADGSYRNLQLKSKNCIFLQNMIFLSSTVGRTSLLDKRSRTDWFPCTTSKIKFF